MRRVALRGLFARKTRLALTALAVALGVTLIAGTYVFTDTINKSFDKIFAASYAGTDVVVTPAFDTNGNGNGGGGEVPGFSESVLAKVRTLPGVGSADGYIFSSGLTLIGKNGKPISSQAPQFVASVHQVKRFESFTLKSGRFPRTASEVALDAGTASRRGFKVGEHVSIEGHGSRKSYALVGLTQIAGVNSFGGASVAAMTLPEAQRLAGEPGRLDEVDIAAKPGVSPATLRATVRRALPQAVTVRTGQQQTSKSQRDSRKNLSFLSTALLAFAGIALFVGAFTIFNTFSITVTQRIREFALLRTLGASRGQIMRVVLAEGFVLGAIGSLIGLGAGILVASGLRALFKAVGFDLPSTSSVILGRTVIVALLVGMIVTMLAALVPAIRATRVPPIVALRQDSAPSLARRSRLAGPLSILLTALGLGLMAVGLFVSSNSTSALTFLGIGAALTFIGVALLSPRLVPPLAGLVGGPLERLFGITGRLARENSRRQPGRTAATAAALMIGVALVSFASIFAAGAKDTFRGQVASALKGPAVLTANSGAGDRFASQASAAVRRVPGVTAVSELRYFQTGSTGVGSVDPATFATVFHLKKGSLDSLKDDQAMVTTKYRDDHHLRIGSVLSLKSPLGGRVRLPVVGFYKDTADVVGDVTVTTATIQKRFGQSQDQFSGLAFAPGVDAGTQVNKINALLTRSYPQAKAKTSSAFVSDQVKQLNQLLGLIYALLALAVLVSLIGIVNTLVLSITERTRELGMLRAIGTSRRQIRSMIRGEALIIALIGGVLGLGLGIVLAVLVTQALDNYTLSLPVGSLLFVLVLAGIAGILSGILPARRAAKLDVLTALAHE